jgi:hypothetical protein
VYDDSACQFHYEVEQHWLWHTPEPVRAAQPLADYRLGRDWIASLDSIELVERNQVLQVVVEVLSGTATANSSRRVRSMRTSAVGGAPTLVRSRDGAVAMRCNIKNGSPGAPRLMWWKLPDGLLELGKVAVHNDTQLR